MEAPDPSDTVVPVAEIHLRRRPGPVFGSGDGVFQPVLSGKYNCAPERSVPDDSLHSSISNRGSASLSHGLRIYYHNVRGLRTKIDSFFLAVSEGDYDVIVLTETWLDDRIYSTQLFGNHYTVFRNDRSRLNSRKTRGGGVLIAVSIKLNCRIDSAPIYDTLEQLWVIIEASGSVVSVGVIYLPPDRKSDLQLIQQHVDSIGSVLSHVDLRTLVLLFGDYNQSGLNWCISGSGMPFVNTPSSQMPVYCCALLDGFSLHGLSQINTVLNRDGRLLDFVLANELAVPNCNISIAHEPLVELEAVHPAITVSLDLPLPVMYDQLSQNTILNFRRADYRELSAAFAEVNWNTILEACSNVDDAVCCFSSAIENITSRIVPVCTPLRKPAWSNARLRKLKRMRAAALRKYCCYRSPYYKNQFNIESNRYHSYNRYLYNRYVNRIQSSLRMQPKQFWSFVNTKRKEIGLPSSMFLGNCVANSEREKCDLFAVQFKQAFSNCIASPAQIEEARNVVPRDVFSFDLPHIDIELVKTALCKLKTSYALGPDGIPSVVLKQCSDVLSSPIAKLFNMSLQQRKFPDRWKFSYLFPVHKKGDKRDITKYRGITSMCACSKLFEIIVNDALFACCKIYIDADQHGFYPKRSVTTNLMQFVSRCLQNLDSSFQTDAIYLDLKAAFDRVDHEILLRKMERLGIFRMPYAGSNLT
ncbi:uncharacterized protein LOC128745842 [Sabethes cyaneus]|uniref:uncharacterized protein LOC128745842 n=1 Tax=Sabethes cyaneus TaxID=53552 RepID=UPI00237E6FB4|nr:uncharacterized protein LOC128745842 [Sabethes cyaneus]